MPTILIVEDNEMNRDMLSRRLLKRGFDVRTAINGIEAIGLAQELPDLILMDLSLPELDGIEATRRIKQSPRTADIPVIALTAHAMTTDRERALAAGCADFDTKPVDFARILEKIGRQLRLRQTDALASPLHPTDVEVRRADGAAPPDQGHLLVVDDDLANRDMLSRRLARRGYDVVCAASGPEALACVERQTFDAVLLDMMMPGMSGLEVLDILRQTYPPLSLPVVMITARDRSEDVVEALGRGATDYITKPVDFTVAAARIRNHVEACRAQRSIRLREERYVLAARASSDAVWDWDIDAGVVHFSEQWGRLTGTASTSEAETLEHWLSLVHPADRECVRLSLGEHLRGGMPQWESEHRLRHADGSYRWVLACGVTVHDAGRPTRMAGSIADVTETRGSDPLTGLPNRLLFLDRLGCALQSVSRCAVLCLDIDRFKEVNDGLGHLAGDELLRQVARRIEAGLRRGDMVGHLSERATLSRLGGDEFAVLLEHVADEAAAQLVAERVSSGMRTPFVIGGREVTASASIGIVVSSADMSALDMLRDADLAMYRAKARGRGLVEIFDQTMREEMQLRLALETDLRQAFVVGEFELLYQPIFELQQHPLLHGFEALVRWRHPVRGLLSPDAFLPVVEEAGMIVELGRWVLRQSCHQLRQWDALQPAGQPLSMSVNVSPQQFATPGLVDDVTAALLDSGIAADRLKLEIVETTLLRGSETVLATLRQLRELGVALVLDDFGTGYSSLSYLQAFPLSTLKIDRSFVMRMNESEHEPLEIVRTIVGLAHNLGLDVTAEGIETPQQLTCLRQLACMFGQGYYFQRPLSADDAQTLLMQPRGEGDPIDAAAPAAARHPTADHSWPEPTPVR